MSSADADTLRFCLAGVEVEITAAGTWIDPLRQRASAFPSSGRAAADLVVRCDPREPGPVAPMSSPAFTHRIDGDRLYLERADAAGVFELGDVVRGQFGVAAPGCAIEAFLRMGLALALPRRGAALVHSSAVAHAGRWSLFAGPSGAGKSTISTLLAGAGAGEKVGDELVLVYPDAGGYRAAVPPLAGAMRNYGASGPIAAIYHLVQAPEHRARRLDRRHACQRLARVLLGYASAPGVAVATLTVIDDLTRRVPAFELEFAPDPGVARVIGLT